MLKGEGPRSTDFTAAALGRRIVLLGAPLKRNRLYRRFPLCLLSNGATVPPNARGDVLALPAWIGPRRFLAGPLA